MRFFKRLKLDDADCEFLVKVLKMEEAEAIDSLSIYVCIEIRSKLEEYLDD